VCQNAMKYYGIASSKLLPPFIEGSLGQLLASYSDCDKVIDFKA